MKSPALASFGFSPDELMKAIDKELAKNKSARNSVEKPGK